MGLCESPGLAIATFQQRSTTFNKKLSSNSAPLPTEVYNQSDGGMCPYRGHIPLALFMQYLCHFSKTLDFACALRKQNQGF